MPQKIMALLDVINDVFGFSWRACMADAIGNEKDRLPGEARKKLKFLRIDGFRNPFRAPNLFFARELKNASNKVPVLVSVIIEAFAELRPELVKEIGTLLNGQEIKEAKEALDEAEPDIARVRQLAEDLKKEALGKYSDTQFGQQEIFNACICALWEQFRDAPEESDNQEVEIKSEELQQESAAKLGSALQNCLAYLRELPASDPAWVEAEHFLQELKSLAAQKRHEAAAEIRTSFQDTLELVMDTGCIEEIGYFGYERILQHDWDQFSTDQIAELDKELYLLMDFTEDYRMFRDMIEEEYPRSFQEEIKKREQLRAREEKVLQQLEKISAYLDACRDSAVAGPETASEPVENEPPVSAPGPDSAEQAEAYTHNEADTVEVLKPEVAEEKETERGSEAPEPERAADLGSSEEPEGQDLELSGQEEPAPDPAVLDILAKKSAREISLLLKEDERDEHWTAFYWALIKESDVAGAYWLGKTPRGTHLPVVPDWLLEALFGAQWVSSDTSPFVADLRDITRRFQPGDSDCQQLLGLAAALRPALVAPTTGMMGWLKVPRCCPALHDLVSSIQVFASYGKAIRPVDLQGVRGSEELDMLARQKVNEIRDRAEEARGRRTGYKRASAVWRAFIERETAPGGMFFLATNDKRDQAGEVRERLQEWSDRNYVEDWINQTDRQLVGRKLPPITGNLRQQLIRNIGEACSWASEWCELVESAKESGQKGVPWVGDRIKELRSHLQAALPQVSSALGELLRGPEPIASAAVWVVRSLADLYTLFGLSHASLSCPPEPNRSQWAWLTQDAENLRVALRRRLLLLPEVSLAEDLTPGAEDLNVVAGSLRDFYSEKWTVVHALDGRMQRQDFRWIDPYLLQILEKEEDYPEIMVRYQDMLAGSRAALEDELRDAGQAVEQAVVDGIISDEERAEYSARLETIDPAATLCFPAQRAKLEDIRMALADAKKTRLEVLSKEWADLSKKILQSSLSQDAKQGIAEFVGEALGRQDTRVVEECRARLMEFLEGGADLDESWFTPAPEKGALQEFLALAPRISEALETRGLQAVLEAARNEGSFLGMDYKKLARGRRDEIINALTSWRKLVQQGRPDAFNTVREMEPILRFLGFNMEPAARNSVTVEVARANWLRMRIRMSAAGHSPVPEFGSQQGGRYDVICLWERPSADTIGGWLRDLKLENRAVLVLYLGRMSTSRRQHMRQMTIGSGVAAAVLDDVLLVFLTRLRDARLPVFFRCALPFTFLNPYTPFQAGDVPPEMFFGRAAMARELQRSVGSSIVYGGRQLGKSALLRHVQRQFHDPEQHRYACVEDIKLVGDPLAYEQTEIWPKIRDAFKKLNLIPLRITTNKSEEIIAHIKKVFDQDPECRVLFLFDEADKFLDADSKNNFVVVEELRSLMVSTGRRFKVVFAGLHNVQRFQGLPNQPLAHFGAPVCVGPLEPAAAQKLIQDPLAALGFRFANSSLVLQILSYTNYHPGLIQLFCQELLKRLRQPLEAMPPYTIKQSDVEAVYRSQDVRDRIRERFDWTLALDPRYKAIAWTMVYDQTGARDGYSQVYSTADIIQLVREWWPGGFNQLGTDQLRALLDEMCGLGVLVRNSHGQYRLRSPNLVRLMGTESDIEDRLLELSYKEPEVKEFNADSYHAFLGDPAGSYSPLTYAQERLLDARCFGVSLVFASKALGIDRMSAACKRLLVPEASDSAPVDYEEIPSAVSNGSEMARWLEQYLERHKKHQRMVVCRQLKGQGNAAELVKAAIRVCGQHKQKQEQWLRVLFLFHAAATWNWLLMPAEEREKLENLVDGYTYPRPWNLVAVQQRLAQNDKIYTDQVCARVCAATGGWPYLLDELFRRGKVQDDLRPVADEMEGELSNASSSLAQEFRWSLGVEENQLPFHVLRFILAEGGVPGEYVGELPTFVHDCPELTPEVCRATIKFLERLGCIRLDGEGTYVVETTVGRVLQHVG